MPIPLPMHVRHQIVEEFCKGKKLIDIAQRYHLCYSTVRGLCKRYKQQGVKGLQPHYDNCGRPKSTTALIHRAALWLKRLHPGWGAALIRIILKNRYRRAPLPGERALQRWFHAAGLYKSKSAFPPTSRPWAKQVHDTWQIDAKEQLRLGGGQRACYVTVVDEKSGALLKAFVFPPLSCQ
jgi:transposase